MQRTGKYDVQENLLFLGNIKLFNNVKNVQYEKYEEELSEITKLQDSLLVLNKINASMELVLLVKKRLKTLTDKKNNLF